MNKRCCECGKEENLTTLCRGCNNRVNYNKDYWKEYFNKNK